MNWVEIVVTVIASVLSGLIGGLFTFLGIRAELKAHRKQDQKRDHELLINNRPKLSIVDLTEPQKFQNKTLDIGIFFTGESGYPSISHDETMQKKDQWDYFKYTLQNTGHTEITHIGITSSNKTRIYNLKTKDHRQDQCNGFIITRIVPPRENCSIAIAYFNDIVTEKKIQNCAKWEQKIKKEMLNNKALSIWLKDINGNWWKQTLIAPKREIVDSQPSSETSFLEEFLVDWEMKKKYRTKRINEIKRYIYHD